MKPTILIIGATGNIGKELIRRFAKNDQKVRVTVRPTSNTEELIALGMELVQADISDVDSLKQAMNGIEKVFFTTPLTPNIVELSSNIVQAAKESQVQHIVKISGAGAETEAITLAKWHRAIEKEIEQTGMTYTFLRPNSFMQNIVNFSAHTIREQGAFYAPTGDGRIALIDVNDIADVAYRVLTEVGHENKSYYLSGPEAISYHEAAAILSKVTGKDISFVDVSADAARESMLDAGMPTEIVDAMLELYQINKMGYTGELSHEVEKITGQKATSFEQFVKGNREVFIK